MNIFPSSSHRSRGLLISLSLKALFPVMLLLSPHMLGQPSSYVLPTERLNETMLPDDPFIKCTCCTSVDHLLVSVSSCIHLSLSFTVSGFRYYKIYIRLPLHFLIIYFIVSHIQFHFPNASLCSAGKA